MASTKISIGSVGVTGHLMALLRKTTDLATVAASVDTYPANDGNFEFMGLDAGVYRMEIRDSPDGTALGTLLNPYYSIDVKSTDLELEYVFYTADGVNPEDPASGQSDIVDSYLDGKNIQGVFKEGFRFLQKDLEYTLIAGGGVHLTNGVQFSPGEVFQVIIANVVPVINTTAGLFAGTAVVTANTTITSAYNNKKIKCAASGTQMILTLDSLSTFVDGKFLYFTTYSGNQHNTVFVTTGGEQIEGYGTQIILGRKEFLWIEKRGSMWEVLDVSDGVDKVGEKVTLGYKSHINTMPEDDTLIDRAEYPRIHDWIKNVLPSSHKITSTDGAIAGLTRADDKMGLFIVSDNKFRMPNTQLLSERGLLSFNNYNTDTSRSYDYPCGTQLPQVGPHRHEDSTYPETDPRFNQGENHPVDSWSATWVHTVGNASTDINKVAPGVYATENRVKNVGVIYARRI